MQFKKNNVMIKNQILALVAFILFSTLSLDAQLSWSPEKITAGEAVTITYDANGTDLAGEKTIIVNIYEVCLLYTSPSPRDS